jgi:N-acetyltransferase
LSTYLQTINTVLSAPSMTDEALKASKAYLFLLPSGSSNRELIVGCVIAQHIKYAMAVATEVPESAPSSDSETTSRLVQVDSGLFCYPERLPTPVGIPRLFVSSAYRRKGVAQTLLNAVCKNFIHGCQLDASKGELAFSQPTSLGRAVMGTFGKGGIRVFEE